MPSSVSTRNRRNSLPKRKLGRACSAAGLRSLDFRGGGLRCTDQAPTQDEADEVDKKGPAQFSGNKPFGHGKLVEYLLWRPYIQAMESPVTLLESGLLAWADPK